MKPPFASKNKSLVISYQNTFKLKLALCHIDKLFFFFEVGGVLFEDPVPGELPRGAAGPGEEEVSHAGDPTQKLGAGASRRREPKHSPPERDGGVLQNPRRSDHRSNTDQLIQTNLPLSAISEDRGRRSLSTGKPVPKLALKTKYL